MKTNQYSDRISGSVSSAFFPATFFNAQEVYTLQCSGVAKRPSDEKGWKKCNGDYTQIFMLNIKYK